MPISLQFFSLFRNLAREADLLHFHHPFPLADAAALLDGCAGRKVVVSYHSDVVRQKWAMPVYKKVQHRFLQLADRILVSSRRMQEHSPFLREFQEKCRVVPYGVRFDDRPEAEFPLPAKDFVLFVGRLVPYKGVEFLIRAMRSVETPLVLAGDGPLRGDLERLAKEEGVAGRVHFLGRLSGDRLRHCFRTCRLFVLPSVMSNEAFGLVQLEAMAFGKPVVNTDLPTSVPEVSRNDETGLTVPPGNPVALAEAIRTILADSRRYDRYARAAADRAREFSMDRYVEAVRGVYRELLRKG